MDETERSLVGRFEVFSQIPPKHHYSIGHIQLFIFLVLFASTGFRCASRSMGIMFSFLGLPLWAPCWHTGRLWLLRLGYYKLIRAKEQAQDWVWIVDHTVQLGCEKCLVILAIRLSALPSPGNSLSHENVEPITLLPVTQSTGEIVFEQLEETIQKTGIPREIIGDHGPDLKSGVEKFCQKYEQTSFVYDIKHKTAALLKYELENDPDWKEFTQLAAQARSRIQQTSLAFLAPPNQRTKSRYMNVDALVQWGERVLTFLEEQKEKPHDEISPFQVREKLGWIESLGQSLAQWSEIMQVIKTAEQFVREQGLFRGCHDQLKGLLTPLACSERAKKVCGQLLAFVAEESFKAKPCERLLGSSEVIESVFGKFKNLEGDQAKSGFTGLLLGIAAMVSTITVEVVQKALETVSTKEVLDWFKKTIGKSLQAKRREAFKSHRKTEQKPDQLELTA